jgi:hypothetical protein
VPAAISAHQTESGVSAVGRHRPAGRAGAHHADIQIGSYGAPGEYSDNQTTGRAARRHGENSYRIGGYAVTRKSEIGSTTSVLNEEALQLMEFRH